MKFSLPRSRRGRILAASVILLLLGGAATATIVVTRAPDSTMSEGRTSLTPSPGATVSASADPQ